MITVSFVIPVFNEEQRIGKAIAALSEGIQFPGIIVEQVIFVNDGSTDDTVSLIEQFINCHCEESQTTKHSTVIPGLTRNPDRCRIKSGMTNKECGMTSEIATSGVHGTRDDTYTVKLISYPKNMGKGYAIRQGMAASTSDYTLFFDADMSTPLSEIEKFVPQMKNDRGVIIGTRKNGKSTVIRHQPLYRELLGKGFTHMTNMLFQTSFTDFTCGFKAFSRSAKDAIFGHAVVNRWAYDAELLFLTHKRTLSHIEVPVVWKNDERTKVRLLKDIPSTMWELIAIRLHHAHPIVSNLAIWTRIYIKAHRIVIVRSCKLRTSHFVRRIKWGFDMTSRLLALK